MVIFTDNNQEATDQGWTNCPKGTSKIYVCTPIRDEIVQEKDYIDYINEKSGDHRAVQWNGNGTWVERFDDAVSVCKQICNENTACNSFNIKRIEFGAGYTCTFYRSMLDNKHCLGVPDGMADVETTYMKTGIGRCEKAVEKFAAYNAKQEKRQIEKYGKVKPESNRIGKIRVEKLTIESCCSLN